MIRTLFIAGLLALCPRTLQADLQSQIAAADRLPAAVGRDARTLHRIDRAFAIVAIDRLGGAWADGSDVRRIAEHEAAISVLDPGVSGRSDRFVVVFEKLPEGSNHD